MELREAVMIDLKLRIELSTAEKEAVSVEELERYIESGLAGSPGEPIILHFECHSWAALNSLGDNVRKLWQKVIDGGRPFRVTGLVDQFHGAIQYKQAASFRVERPSSKEEIKIEVNQFIPDLIVVKHVLELLYPDQESFKNALNLKEDFEAEMAREDIFELFLAEKEVSMEEEGRTLLLLGETTVEAIVGAVNSLNQETMLSLTNTRAGRVREILESEDFLNELKAQTAAQPDTELVKELVHRGENFLSADAYSSTFYFYSSAVKLAEDLKATGRGSDQLDGAHVIALLRRAHFFNMLKYEEESLADFDLVVGMLRLKQQEQDLASALFGRGFAREKLGLKEEALQDYSEAIELLNNRTEAERYNDGLLSLVYRCRSNLYTGLSRPDLAGADLEKAENLKLPQEKLNELFYGEAQNLNDDSDSGFVDTAMFPAEAREELRRLYTLANPEAKFNIFAERGSQVIYLGAGGSDLEEDRAEAELRLNEGELYTVLTTLVSDVFSYVLLSEFPDVPFNTVYFRDLVN
jgi:tetratricopeptide (TPR) repeat protein